MSAFAISWTLSQSCRSSIWGLWWNCKYSCTIYCKNAWQRRADVTYLSSAFYLLHGHYCVAFRSCTTGAVMKDLDRTDQPCSSVAEMSRCCKTSVRSSFIVHSLVSAWLSASPGALIQSGLLSQEILSACWAYDLRERPTFTQLADMLEKLPKLNRRLSHPGHFWKSAE